MFMPFTATHGTMVHCMTVSLTLWLTCNQLVIGQSLSLLVMPMLITLSGWSESLLLIDMGEMLLIFAICPVVSIWCAVLLTLLVIPLPLKPRYQGRVMGFVGGGGNIAIATALPPSSFVHCIVNTK